MSKLEELILQYCPDGVEYKPLGDILSVNRGRRLTKSQLSDDGKYYVYHGSKDTPLGKYVEFNVKGNTTIVVNTGGIGGVKFCENDFWCSDGSFWIGHSNRMNDKFVYYYLSPLESYFASQKRVGGVPTIDRSVVENVEIPVPPLPVQEEIVKILDKFSLLSAELEAELEGRRKQFDFYRNQLLSFDSGSDSVVWKKLGDFCEIKTGSKPEKIMSYSTRYEYINAGTTNSGYTKIANSDGNAVTTPSRGQGGIGYVGYQRNPFWLGPLCYRITSKSPLLITRFLYHFLNCHNELILKLKNTGGAPALNRQDLVEILIPIPSLSEQQRIVDILDRFDTLTNDLASGLPAEIEKRKKQYEHYRDKLLTFKRKEA